MADLLIEKVVAAVDAVGVDGEQDCDAVPSQDHPDYRASALADVDADADDETPGAKDEESSEDSWSGDPDPAGHEEQAHAGA